MPECREPPKEVGAEQIPAAVPKRWFMAGVNYQLWLRASRLREEQPCTGEAPYLEVVAELVTIWRPRKAA